MIIKRIIKKLLKEYIFVFSLAGVFLALSFCLDDCATLQNWLISISASLFTVPLVFVTYDEYSKSVKEKTYCILYRENQKIINDVFACFLYFTSYFFNPIENPSFDYDVIFTKNIELKKEEIKGKIVSNSFSGFFVFPHLNDLTPTF